MKRIFLAPIFLATACAAPAPVTVEISAPPGMGFVRPLPGWGKDNTYIIYDTESLSVLDIGLPFPGDLLFVQWR